MENINNYNDNNDDNNELNIPFPNQIGYTIYSKSGCKNCSLAKSLLINKKINFFLINCDDFLIDYKNEFLNFMEKIIKKSYKMFPMIFYDGKFIGGYKELEDFLIILNTFENNNIYIDNKNTDLDNKNTDLDNNDCKYEIINEKSNLTFEVDF